MVRVALFERERIEAHRRYVCVCILILMLVCLDLFGTGFLSIRTLSINAEKVNLVEIFNPKLVTSLPWRVKNRSRDFSFSNAHEFPRFSSREMNCTLMVVIITTENSAGQCLSVKLMHHIITSELLYTSSLRENYNTFQGTKICHFSEGQKEIAGNILEYLHIRCW